MFEYTLNNHYKFGWNGTLWNDPDPNHETHKYFWKIGALNDPRINTWKKSCYYAAQHIESLGYDIWVAFSGGIDSEVAMCSFLGQGIPVKAAIVCYNNGLNILDYKAAVSFCEANNVEYKIFNLDIIDFVTNQSQKYVDRHKMISPQIPVQLWLLEQCEEYLVYCGGDLRLSRYHDSIDHYYLTVKPQTSTVHRAMIYHDRPGCPYFHSHTPEQLYNFLNDDLVKLWKAHSYSMKMQDIKWYKPIVYENSWGPLTPRRKLTGFELFEGLDLEYRRRYQQANIKFNTDIIVPEKACLDMLSNDEHGYYESPEK